MKKILVTGGAGYIGSFTVLELLKAGYQPVILDNMSTGHDFAVFAPIYKVDLLDQKKVYEVFKKKKIDVVIHFAALSQAGESMEKPHLYFDHNTRSTNNLLAAMAQAGVKKIIFSSSCSVYGTPKKLPVTEKSQIQPESVYAQTKVWGENMLDFYRQNYDINYISLRYFNACGAKPGGKLGELRDPQTRLIPNVVSAAISEKTFVLNGDDYPTKDGTCVRDYIHVEDLARAHVSALEYLCKNNKSDVFNIGTGKGFSINEIIKTTEKISGKSIDIKIGKRRFGDPAKIYADNTKACKILKWNPKNSALESIISSELNWQKAVKHLD